MQEGSDTFDDIESEEKEGSDTFDDIESEVQAGSDTFDDIESEEKEQPQNSDTGNQVSYRTYEPQPSTSRLNERFGDNYTSKLCCVNIRSCDFTDSNFIFLFIHTILREINSFYP